MATDSRRRVKLYVLNRDSQWDDCGTGHVSPLLTDQEPRSLHLHVRSEADGKEHRDAIYFPASVFNSCRY